MGSLQRIRISCAAIVILTVTCTTCHCGAVPLSNRPTAASQVQSRRDLDPKCAFDGMPEVYGLGIRLGVYLQWISAFVANQHHADSVRDLLATNTIFLLALFIALAIMSTQDTTRAAEVLILSQICFGFIATVSTIWGLRVQAKFTTPKKFGDRVNFPILGSTVRLCLASAICSYNIWFWFVGVDKLSMRTPSCRTTGFLVVPVDVLGGVRVFFKTIAVVAAIFFYHATASEVSVLLWNWTYYSLCALIATFVISFHRILHFNHFHKSKEKQPTLTKQALIYSPIYLFSVPWIIVNGAIGVRLTRRQSWLIISVIQTRIFIFWPSVFSILFHVSKHKPEETSHGNESPSPQLGELWSRTIKERPARDDSDEIKASTNNDYVDDVNVDVVQPFPTVQQRECGGDGLPDGDPERATARSKKISTSTTLPGVFQTIKARWKQAEDLPKWLQNLVGFLPILNAVSLVWSIVAIELIIKWNNISNVYTIQSVGQLIPFIIGIVGFLKLILLDINVQKNRAIIYNIIMQSFLEFHLTEEMHGANFAAVGEAKDTKNVPGEFLGFGRFAAKHVPMLGKCIGEQILNMLEEESKHHDGSADSRIRSTNAKLARDVFQKAKEDGVQKDDQKETIETAVQNLHKVDINLEELVMKLVWLHLSQWWDFLMGWRTMRRTRV